MLVRAWQDTALCSPGWVPGRHRWSGLVFVGWEPAVFFPGTALTVAYYLQALVPHAMPQDSAIGVLMQIFREVPSIATSLASLTVIAAVALWSAARAVEGHEYVLDQ